MNHDHDLHAQARRLGVRADGPGDRNLAEGVLGALGVSLDRSYSATDPRPARERADSYVVGLAVGEARKVGEETACRMAMRGRLAGAHERPIGATTTSNVMRGRTKLDAERAERGDAQAPSATVQVDPDDLDSQEARGENYAYPSASNKLELQKALESWPTMTFQTPAEKEFARRWLLQRCADLGVPAPRLDADDDFDEKTATRRLAERNRDAWMKSRK